MDVKKIKSTKKLKKSFDLLKTLSECKRNMRKSILKNADKDLVNSVCEYVLNVLNGNVRLDQTTLNHLVKHKKTLRNLIDAKNKKRRKQILIQKGGFIEYLLPPLLQVVADLITSD